MTLGSSYLDSYNIATGQSGPSILLPYQYWGNDQRLTVSNGYDTLYKPLSDHFVLICFFLFFVTH